MADGLKKVNRQILQKAHDFLLTDVILTPKAPPMIACSNWKTSKLCSLSAVGAALVVCLGILDFSGFLARYFKIRPALESTHLAGSKTPPSTSAPVRKDDVDAMQAKNTEVPQPKPDTKIQTSAPGLSSNQPSPAEAKVEQPPAGSATANFRQLPKELKIKRGDTLTKIAAEWYPKNVELGLVAILLANPETINADLISPGQKLNLPLINPEDRTIALKENLFYAFYDSYVSMETLQKNLSWLGHRGVRYVVVNTKDAKGRVTHRVLIGGYDRQEDLGKALQRSQARQG